MVHAGRQEAGVLQRSSGGCRTNALQNRPDYSVLMVCLCVQDAYARGEVFIGSKESGYTALDGLPPNIQGSHWQFGITIVTPDRKFLFACETEPNQKDWMAAFQTVINRPMLPQEYAGELKFHLFVHPQTPLNLTFFFLHIFSAVEAYFKHKPWLCAEYAPTKVKAMPAVRSVLPATKSWISVQFCF